MLRRTSFTKRTRIFFLLTLLVSVNVSFAPELKRTGTEPEKEEVCLYEQLRLAEIGLKEEIFDKAFAGLQKVAQKEQDINPSILSIADFSQSSGAKRLYVLDLAERTVLFNTYVSHGMRSGMEYACKFGNRPESHRSSLGFYLTGECYKGAHGLSLRLKGLEKGINHNAEQRGIVIHGADYVSEKFIRQNGRLGRSQGCPAVPQKECAPIVSSIQNGTCFFIFYPDSNYFKRSPVLRSSDL
jgi:hypothetical protein